MSRRLARILGFHSNPRVLFLRTALAVFVMVFGATAIITFLTPRRFTSEAKLLVRYVLENPLDVPAAGKSISDERRTRGKRILERQVQLVLSDAVLEQVVKSQRLETRWAKTSDQRLTTGEAVAMLRGGVKLHVPSGSNLIHLRVNSQDAKEATHIAAAIIDAYLAECEEDIDRQIEQLRSTVGEDVLRVTPLSEFVDVTNLHIIQSPTPGDKLVLPNVPGWLLVGGAGGFFLALILGVAVTLLAKRRAPQESDDPPTSSASAVA